MATAVLDLFLCLCSVIGLQACVIFLVLQNWSVARKVLPKYTNHIKLKRNYID